MAFGSLRTRRTALAAGAVVAVIAVAGCGAGGGADTGARSSGWRQPSFRTAGRATTPATSKPNGAGRDEQGEPAGRKGGPSQGSRDDPVLIASHDRGSRRFTVVGHTSEQGYCVDVRAGRPSRPDCDPVPVEPPELQLRILDSGGESYLVGIVDDRDISDVDLIADDGSPVVESAEEFELVTVMDGRARAFAPRDAPKFVRAVVARDARGAVVARQRVGDGDDPSGGNPDGGFSTGDKSGSGSATGPEPAKLTDVRLVRREGSDLIRLEFAAGTGTPDYQVGYRPRPVRLEGSGKPADLNGGPALVVDLTHAVDGGTATGAVPVAPERQSIIAQVMNLGSFEGHVKLGIGLVEANPKPPFRVRTGPHSITIGIDYPGP